MASFTGLKHLAQRVAKLEQLVRYLLNKVEPGLPDVDFIVDAFDRPDAGTLGVYWSNPQSFQILEEGAVSFVGYGGVQTNEQTVGFYTSRLTESPSPSAYVRSTVEDVQAKRSVHIAPFIHDIYDLDNGVYRDPTSDTVPAKCLASYKGKLTSDNHIVEVGFSVIRQEALVTLPALDAFQEAYGSMESSASGYLSAATLIRPVLRYDEELDRGIVCAGILSHNTGEGFTTYLNATFSLAAVSEGPPPINWPANYDPPYNSDWALYTSTAPYLENSHEHEESITTPDFVGYTFQVSAFSGLGYEYDIVNEDTLKIQNYGWWDYPEYTANVNEVGSGFELDDGTSRSVTYTNTVSPFDNVVVTTANFTTYWNGAPTDLYIRIQKNVNANNYPSGIVNLAVVGTNRLRFAVSGTTVTVTLNGTQIGEFTVSSVAEGGQVGMFSWGDAQAICDAWGITCPRVEYFKAWREGDPEPAEDESGHGVFVDGERVWKDSYHDSEGAYNPPTE